MFIESFKFSFRAQNSFIDKRMYSSDESVEVSVDEVTGEPGAATAAWCISGSEGETMFKFAWKIGDYQRKKESIKRDDFIRTRPFCAVYGNKKTLYGSKKKSLWYLTFLPNGAAADKEVTGHDNHDDDGDTMQDDVGVYLYQQSHPLDYVSSLKFRISFLNPRSGEKMVVYDHPYGRKYRVQDGYGWGISNITVNKDFINDDTLTIICEMTIPGNDRTM